MRTAPGLCLLPVASRPSAHPNCEPRRVSGRVLLSRRPLPVLWNWLQQVDHALGQSLFTKNDVQVARGRDLFENFQFP